MLKDTDKSSLETTTNTTQEASRRRSERVVLRVPVILSAILHGGKHISVQAESLVVNAHGGLLDVGMEMIAGQHIRLINLSTQIATTGRVLRVEGSEEGRFSVAFEFESPVPHFWPVKFPPADWSIVQSRA